MHYKAERCIRDLFQAFLASPSQLPPNIYKQAGTDGMPRAVCDYIAGMTDRSAMSEYRKLFTLDERA